MTRRAVVFGGSGFLGSHMADALTAAGWETVIFDRAESPWRLPSQHMLVGNILDTAQVNEACEGAEVVFNFAGIADIGAADRDPVMTCQVNVVGTLNTIEAALKAKARRYMFASTVYVYSELGGFYRASKQSCERFIETYHDRRGLEFTILRYGTLYGRRSGPGNRIWMMLTQALREGRISYPGSGAAQRDFIHARDAALLSLRAMEPDFANRHLLITGQERLEVRYVARMIREMMGRRIELQFLEGEPEGHYELTPYAFSPRMGTKMVPTDYVDLGQGVLDCLNELYENEVRRGAAHADPAQEAPA